MNIDEYQDKVGGAVGGLWPNLGARTTIPPFPILQAQLQAQTQARAETSIKTAVSVLITRVRNGYFVRTPEGDFIASSIDEITKLVAVAVAALELDR